MLDCMIIGSGVAGISAALTLKAHGKNFVLFGDPNLSEKISKAERIDNYPALTSVTGKEFVTALKAQLSAANIQVTDERVTGVYALKSAFSALTESGKTFEAKTVILATGVQAVKELDGEKEFLGRGVSYCATCDGELYRDKTVAVVSDSARHEEEIEYLADRAKKVYLFPLYKGVSVQRENVELLKRAPTKVIGTRRVEAVCLGEERLALDGVFFLKESLPPSVLTGGLETENGHIKVTRNLETNLKGCFAAGDCTGRPYQYAKAAGEGNVAAFSVSAYLSENKEG